MPGSRQRDLQSRSKRADGEHGEEAEGIEVLHPQFRATDQAIVPAAAQRIRPDQMGERELPDQREGDHAQPQEPGSPNAADT